MTDVAFLYMTRPLRCPPRSMDRPVVQHRLGTAARRAPHLMGTDRVARCFVTSRPSANPTSGLRCEPGPLCTRTASSTACGASTISIRRSSRRNNWWLVAVIMALSARSITAFVRIGTREGFRPLGGQAIRRQALQSHMMRVASYSSTSPLVLRKQHTRTPSRLSATTKPSLADELVAAGFPRDFLDYVKNKELPDEFYEEDGEEDSDDEEDDEQGLVAAGDKAEDEGGEGIVRGAKKAGKDSDKGTIHIRNSQRGIDIDLDLLQRQIEVIMDILGRPDHDVSLWLTNDRTIREYNDRYRGKRKATDILSFGFHEYDKPEVPTQESLVMNGAVKDLGDMIISVPYVKRQCERDQKDAQDSGESMWTGERGASGAMADIYDVAGRLPYLVIHGVLHLLGHDHETDEEYAVMVKQEEELIAEFRRRMGEAGTGAASK